MKKEGLKIQINEKEEKQRPGERNKQKDTNKTKDEKNLRICRQYSPV
jgi:hypothetical protein